MSKKTFEPILALDIGTQSIKTVISLPSDDHQKLLGAQKTPLEPNTIIDGRIADFDRLLDSCEDAISSTKKIAKASPKSVVIGVAGEFVKNIVSTVSYHRSSPEKPISSDELSYIFSEVKARTIQKTHTIFNSEELPQNSAPRVINTELISTKIDGQSIPAPIGATGAEIEMHFFDTFLPEKDFAALEQLCTKLQLDLTSIVSEPFALAKLVLENTTKKPSALILDVGSQKTSFALLKNGLFQNAATFNLGIDNLSKDLSIWSSSMAIALESLREKTLPAEILLAGGGALNSDFQEQLILSDWYEKLPFVSRPIIDLISVSELSEFANVSSLDESFLTALGLLHVSQAH